MTLNVNGFYRIPKMQSVKKYQSAISSKPKVQQNLLSASIHTSIYVSALESGFEYGLIIPGFWVRIPEGPPESFEAGHAARPLYIASILNLSQHRRETLLVIRLCNLE